MSNVDLMFMHEAVVEPFLGTTPTGKSYGPPVTLSGLLDDGLMQTPTEGGYQLVSKTTFFTHLSNADSLPVGSRLTCNDRQMTVSGSRRRDGGWLLAGASHLEVDVE